MIKYHYFFLVKAFKKINYTVQYVLSTSDSKDMEVCLYKKFWNPNAAEVRGLMEALGYRVAMTDCVTVPGKIIVDCSY